MFIGFKTKLSKTGKVYFNVDPENVKHERRKLKKQFLLVKENKMTIEKVLTGYKCWKAHVERGCSFKLLQRMDKYIMDLWKEYCDEN